MSVRLIDMVFPGDANHHGTLFGGVGMAHLDKIAFLAASRHARRAFVTASCDRLDFTAPALIGEMVEASGRVVRVGRASLTVEVQLHAEALLSGERRLCTRGLFHMVAVDRGPARPPLPPLPAEAEGAANEEEAKDWAPDAAWLSMVDMVLPARTNHYGGLFGGDALDMMGKAAFIAATRRARAVMVMAASRQIDFTAPIKSGDMVELRARVTATGRTSLTTEVELWGEDLLSGVRTRSAVGAFVMVAVDPEGRPAPPAGL
jgi:acyl-CoA hydrolase